MKRLLIGNAAIARGAYEAGITVATAYPGTPSTEIVDTLSTYEGVKAQWSPNEKVAMEVAAGASIAGARTLVAMKHVGVNVAADPLFSMSYIGVNGGMVIVSADDPGLHSSQDEQDNRGYGIFAKLPIIEPSNSQEALDFTRMAFDLSEAYDTPVMLRITTRLAHSQTMVELGQPQPQQLKPYKKDAPKNVLLPVFAKAKHAAIEQQLDKLRAEANDSPFNRIEWGDKSLGIITSGVVYQYVKEVLPDASVLKLGMVNPLPEKLVREFAGQVERLVVIEELEPVIETQIKAWGIPAEGKNVFSLLGEYSPEMIAERLGGAEPADGFHLDSEVPGRPPLLCPGCPHRGIFHVLRRMKLTVTGDIGCYTLAANPPLGAMDTSICMGASIGASLGMEKARGRDFARNVVAVIGDSTFIHSGITGLIDVVYNQGTNTVIILDNSTTAMTGHQDHPATGVTLMKEPTHKLDLPALIKAIGINNVYEVDPLDLTAVRDLLKQELVKGEPSVIITRRPCALLNVTPPKPPIQVDPDKCVGCKACIKVGCTGVHFLEAYNKAEITVNCISCGVCEQVCAFGAIKPMEV